MIEHSKGWWLWLEFLNSRIYRLLKNSFVSGKSVFVQEMIDLVRKIDPDYKLILWVLWVRHKEKFLKRFTTSFCYTGPAKKYKTLYSDKIVTTKNQGETKKTFKNKVAKLGKWNLAIGI